MSSSHLVALHVKWRGNLIIFENVDPHWTSIAAIKAAVEEKTGVAPCDQKLMGLGIKMGNATPAEDAVSMSSVAFKNKNGVVNIQLMGTPQAELIEQQAREIEQLKLSNSSVLDDLSLSKDMTPATREWRKLQEFAQKVEIHFLNKPRAGKKLLILDLDHTLMHFDSKEEGQVANTTSSTNHNMYQSNHNAAYCQSMKRPYLDYFLSSVYPHYDIVMWSQTHWRWIEIKLTELGIINNPGYKVCFILDKSSMFKIPPTGYVKPLHIIWSKFSHLWGKHNTVHVDDMERNFVLNKQTGLLVTPFYRNGYINAKNDILTHTLSPAAYGAEGLILGSIATVTSNSYMNVTNYATNNIIERRTSKDGGNADGNSSGGNGEDRPKPVGNLNLGCPHADPYPLSTVDGACDVCGNPNLTHVIVNSVGNLVPGAQAAAAVVSPGRGAAGDAAATSGDSGDNNSGGGSVVTDSDTLAYHGPNLTSVATGTTTAAGSAMQTVPVFHPEIVNVAVNSENILAPTSDDDIELYHLTRYIINISHIKDLSVLDHSRWRLHCHHVVMPKGSQFDPNAPKTGMSSQKRNGSGSGSGSGSGKSGGSPAGSGAAAGRSLTPIDGCAIAASSSSSGGDGDAAACTQDQASEDARGVTTAAPAPALAPAPASAAVGVKEATPRGSSNNSRAPSRSNSTDIAATNSGSGSGSGSGKSLEPQPPPGGSPIVPPLSFRPSGGRLPTMSPGTPTGGTNSSGSVNNPGSNARSSASRGRSGVPQLAAGGGAAAASAIAGSYDNPFKTGSRDGGDDNAVNSIATSRSDNGGVTRETDEVNSAPVTSYSGGRTPGSFEQPAVDGETSRTRRHGNQKSLGSSGSKSRIHNPGVGGGEPK